jgi:hypothetical protein
MDFTLITYRNLINSLQQQGFSFLTFEEFVKNPEDKVIVLRHDVDLLPKNSLRFAQIQVDMGIKGTYYFRIVPESFDEKIIKEIYEMGHEVGYHYEDVSLTAQRHKGAKAQWQREEERQKTKGKRQKEGRHTDLTFQLFNFSTDEEELVKIAIAGFRENLAKLRELVPVKTICMHGSPMSRWDSRLLWKYYDYHDFGIIGEPYFDVNFNEVLYLTDTGRRWDGDSYNIRDKVEGRRRKAEGEKEGEKERGGEGEKGGENHVPLHPRTVAPSHPLTVAPSSLPPSALRPQSPTAFPRFHSTFDIIRAAGEGRLPDKIMMTFHPQRWSDKPVPWVKELVWQNLKNVGKYFLVKISNR